MKLITTLAILFSVYSSHAQFIDWGKEDTSGHNLYLYVEGSYQIFSAAVGLRVEYTHENREAENLFHYSLGVTGGRTIGSASHISNFDFANYVGSFAGIQIGRKQLRIETTGGYGLLHENGVFELPSRSRWTPNYTLGCRHRGPQTLFRAGIGYPFGWYVSFGNRIF